MIIIDDKYKIVAGKSEFTEEEYINIRKEHPEIEIEYAKKLKAELDKQIQDKLAEENTRLVLERQSKRETLLAERRIIEEDLKLFDTLTYEQYQIHILKRDKMKKLSEIDMELK